MILFPVSPRYNIRNWVTEVFEGDRLVLPLTRWANDDEPKNMDEIWLMAFYHSNQSTADFITGALQKIARGDPTATGDLEDWVTSLDILAHNYKMTRRNPVYIEDEE